jgi:hypothetical protein
VYQVAEVVRNLAARNRDASLSAAERTMYDRARINLISEIAPALKVSAEEAERYLDEALAKGVLKPAKEPAKRSPARLVAITPLLVVQGGRRRGDRRPASPSPQRASVPAPQRALWTRGVTGSIMPRSPLSCNSSTSNG